jgi:hypothetical protein
MYWCYALNALRSGRCVACGCEIAAPAGAPDVQRLVWALGHPDSDRAMLAAKTLGARKALCALPALRGVVDARIDPFLAAQALRSAIEIAGVEKLGDWLRKLARSNSLMLRELATTALRARS